MKINGTVTDLLEIDRQITEFPFALRCLKDFLSNNSIRLHTAKEKITALHEEFFILDETNKPKMQNKVILTEQELASGQHPQEPVMKEGKKIEDYLLQQEILLSQEIEIIF